MMSIRTTVVLATSLAVAAPASGAIDPVCEEGSSPSSFVGEALRDASSDLNGITFNTSSARLQLVPEGGLFTAQSLGVADPLFMACAADFDEDGWDDFVGTGYANGASAAEYAKTGVKVYRNRTFENPAPDWTDPSALRTPKFVPTWTVENAPTTNGQGSGVGSYVCGDFNGDGNADFAYMRCLNAATTACAGSAAKARMFLGNGNGTFAAGYQFVAAMSTLDSIGKEGNLFTALDYDKDGDLDLIYAAKSGAAAGSNGFVKVLLNNGAASPMFGGTVVTRIANAGMQSVGATGVAVGDFTNDSQMDAVVGGQNSLRLALYPNATEVGTTVGTAKNLASAADTSGTLFSGGATIVLAADFSLDGKVDLIVGTDGFGGYPGGRVFYFSNDGDGSPFSGGASQMMIAGSATDLDVGFVFPNGYDGDPQNTPDFVVADGNNSAQYYLFANRTVSTYVACGTVESSLLDLGGLSTSELTVTAARITPDSTIPADTSLTWEASNDGGTTWHAAPACADDAASYCANFTTTIGSDIRWRATMCSNGARTRTPEISGVQVGYTYVLAEDHYRAGPVAYDGIVYAGSFRQPGDAGDMTAVDEGTGAQVWSASALLDARAPSDRTIYTATATNTRLDFAVSSAGSSALQAVLLASSTAEAATVIAWWFSARFGLINYHVMGAIENSTAAILSPPAPPYWYGYDATSPSERSENDTFQTTYASRPQLIFAGSKDGALHAFRAVDGTEAWAFIPYDVAQRLRADRAAGTITAYPDGAPTLADAKIGGAWRTVLVAGEANGGRGIYALDVTDSESAGPTPLWRYDELNMGRTYSKPSIIRTRISGNERWLAVFASGPGLVGDLGDSLYAVDLETGALVWSRDLGEANTYFATDVAAVEIDDGGTAPRDGFIDRLYVGDNKGRLWKVDPENGVLLGASGTGQPLFTTEDSVLGVETAIAGTIAVAPDASGRVAVYFGTGGTEDASNTVQNGFFKIWADSGEVDQVVASPTIPVGAKFYGGVTYNDGQVIYTLGSDTGSGSLCDPTAGQISVVNATTLAAAFAPASAGAKIAGPIFAIGGTIYAITMQGVLAMVGTPGGSAQGTTGDDAGGGSGSGAGGSVGELAEPIVVRGWREVR